MRKFVSILMLAILVVNLFGIPAILLGWRIHHNRQAEARLDNDLYSVSDVVTLMIPISLPYAQDQDFRRVNGQFQYGNEFLRVFQQRYRRDTITIVCIRDHAAKEIDHALTEFTKTLSDSQQSEQPSNGKLIISFCKEYLNIQFAIRCVSTGWCNELLYKNETSRLPLLSFESPDHPPQTIGTV